MHATTRSTRLPPGSAPEQDHSRVSFWRSFGLASVALLAGCSYSDVGPALATVTVVVPAASIAPARTKELSDAEDFLGRAMRLHDLITRLGDSSSSSPLRTIQQRVREDIATYGRLEQGLAADGTSVVAQGARPTSAQMQEMQDAAWMQSGATQAEWSVGQFSHALSGPPITTDAQKVHADITGDGTGLHPEQVISDLQTFLQDIEVVVAPVNKLITLRESDGSALTPKSGAGALLVYLGPVMKEINDARSSVTALLDASGSSQLQTDLTRASRGQDRVGEDGGAGTRAGSE